MIHTLDRKLVERVQGIAGFKYRILNLRFMPQVWLKEKYTPKKISYRVFDIVLSLLMILALSPILAAIAGYIYLTEGGPVLFRQQRLGVKGKLFTLFKFRSMCTDAEKILKEDKELYKKYVANDYKLEQSEDPRITPLGRFLRKTSLDELPQFFCVLKGDMSLVGPRPIVEEEIERYGTYSDEFLAVKPGITGLWQVVGRSDIEYPQRKFLDVFYVRHKSLWVDIKILLSTVVTVFKGSGAH